MKDYEENHTWSTFWSWFFILALSFGLISWAMTMMTLVEDVPREWDFGNREFTPAKSIYSTHNPENTTDSLMVHPLPDAVSMEELQKEN